MPALRDLQFARRHETAPPRDLVRAITALGAQRADIAELAGTGHPSFRVRSDFNAPLNADQKWAAALNENVTIDANRPFRVRFEIERAPGSTGARQFRLQYRRNRGEWIDVEARRVPQTR